MELLSLFVLLVHYLCVYCLWTKMHQKRSIAASSQEQKAAHATAQLDEAVKERNHLEQKTIAQQAKIENTIQVYYAGAIIKHF